MEPGMANRPEPYLPSSAVKMRKIGYVPPSLLGVRVQAGGFLFLWTTCVRGVPLCECALVPTALQRHWFWSKVCTFLQSTNLRLRIQRQRKQQQHDRVSME